MATTTLSALGMKVMTCTAEGIIANLSYNALNITAVMVITGVCMALYRRLKNMQARAEQKFMYDFLPLYMLLLVSITGLALTFMNIFLHGTGAAAYVPDPPMVSHYYINLSAIRKTCTYSIPPTECICKKLQRALCGTTHERM